LSDLSSSRSKAAWVPPSTVMVLSRSPMDGDDRRSPGRSSGIDRHTRELRGPSARGYKRKRRQRNRGPAARALNPHFGAPSETAAARGMKLR
jgi:hypothetical protein